MNGFFLSWSFIRNKNDLFVVYANYSVKINQFEPASDDDG